MNLIGVDGSDPRNRHPYTLIDTIAGGHSGRAATA